MKSIQIFDPALCCSSGVCGTDVDQKLVDFSADVDWARQQGAVIERFNLAQQPMAFVENAAVKDLLQQSGEAALPVVLVDGQVMQAGHYPTREVLAQWLDITLAPTLFTPQVAELIAIGAAIASNCKPCFKFHFDTARKLGVSTADMLQAVNLAQQVKDSPAKSVLELARKFLQPAAAPATASSNAGCCGGKAADTAPAASCCGGSTPAAAANTGCCGAPAAATTATAASAGCCGGTASDAPKTANKCC